MIWAESGKPCALLHRKSGDGSCLAKVTLPHCFNAEDAVDPDVNYYQGPGWYKTLLKIDNPYADGRIILDFEGAGQKTKVYVYTTLVGEHTGGYDGWSVDITEAVKSFMADDKQVKRFKEKSTSVYPLR